MFRIPTDFDWENGLYTMMTYSVLTNKPSRLGPVDYFNPSSADRNIGSHCNQDRWITSNTVSENRHIPIMDNSGMLLQMNGADPARSSVKFFNDTSCFPGDNFTARIRFVEVDSATESYCNANNTEVAMWVRFNFDENHDNMFGGRWGYDSINKWRMYWYSKKSTVITSNVGTSNANKFAFPFEFFIIKSGGGCELKTSTDGINYDSMKVDSAGSWVTSAWNINIEWANFTTHAGTAPKAFIDIFDIVSSNDSKFISSGNYTTFVFDSATGHLNFVTQQPQLEDIFNQEIKIQYRTSANDPSGDAGSFPVGWTKRQKVTIDSSKVTGGAHTDIPILLKDDNLADGIYNNSQANGEDIRFTSDEDGLNQLEFDILEYDTSGKTCIIWVKVPSISSAADVDIYVWAGNGAASAYAKADTYGQYNVWSDFKAMWSGKDKTTSTIEDRTSNEYTGTKQAANEPIEANGKIEKAQDFDGSNDNILCGDLSALDFGTGDFAFSFWFYTHKTTNSSVLGKDTFPGSGNSYTGWFVQYSGGGAKKINFSTRNIISGSGVQTYNISNSAYNENTWHHVFCVRRSGTLYLYVNGVLDRSLAQAGSTNVNNSSQFKMGLFDDDATPFYLDGLLENIMFHDQDISANRIQTEFNNQDDPSTFSSAGVVDDVNLSANTGTFIDGDGATRKYWDFADSSSWTVGSFITAGNIAQNIPDGKLYGQYKMFFNGGNAKGNMSVGIFQVNAPIAIEDTSNVYLGLGVNSMFSIPCEYDSTLESVKNNAMNRTEQSKLNSYEYGSYLSDNLITNNVGSYMAHLINSFWLNNAQLKYTRNIYTNSFEDVTIENSRQPFSVKAAGDAFNGNIVIEGI